MRTKKFWIYPVEGNKYWKCEVHLLPNQRRLEQRYFKDTGKGDVEDGKTTLGAFFQILTCTLHQRGKKPRKIGRFGQLLFNAERININTIAHECGHAAHEYCRRKRIYRYNRRKMGGVECDEETYCYALGAMVDQITTKLIKMGYEFDVPEDRAAR